MKKIIAVLLAVLLIAALSACSGNSGEQTQTSGGEDNPTDVIDADVIDGGYGDAASHEITEDIRKLVDKVNKTLTGAQYIPVVYLASQVVAGTNHLILCKMIPTVPAAAATYALVTIYEDLEGNAEVTESLDSRFEAPYVDEDGNQLAGGWSEPETTEVTDEAKAALNKACETLAGAEYEPVALLSTQIVAGTNYAMLCKVTPTVPDAASHYAIVTVYADLQGGAEITGVYDFGTDDIPLDAEAGEIAADSQAE